MIPADAGIDLDGYFARIGYQGAHEATAATLHALHLLHPCAIPFENLDPLLGRPVRLDPDSLQRKLVRDGRGGYCYEHNLLFGQVLAILGFRVTGLAARVLWNRPEGTVGPRSHMLLRVELADGPWIADVGFGGLTMTAPLRLAPGREQPTPHGPFRIVPAGDDLRMEGLVAGIWKPLYRFDLTPHLRVDYEVSSYFLSTHPASHFVTGLMVARPTGTGRLTLANTRLSIHHPDAPSEHHTLGSAEAIMAALEERFGITLPDRPALQTRLAALVAEAPPRTP
ncbi:Arylamine N-acetyltransferase [Rhodovastum atsumiense]|uniref:Arylamine N-acetyltransferase n=1 Tax=Rhodovastum atsumiense TaxID=504468 RepID=A0A5M6IV13_9PROT|nr:arylamine N-acetyltransferase [Rhodovastum atsumiense]KAA5611697.1 arylamine N-acetyltransferase [Rhodovastum atsumiense]CAH2604272.1 Arylamine N-acetyltransferase [Rhodovastum atsumiense]